MAFKGKDREIKAYNKYVGFFNANVVAINPTKEQLSKLLGNEIEKDLNYTDVSSETGAKKLTLSFWLKEETTGVLFNVRFNLEDTVVVSKSGKTQYINNIGSTSYAEDQNQIPSFITDNNRKVRKAKKGEELLYKFLRNWVASSWKFDDPNTELVLDDWKGLMNGKVSEIQDVINNNSDKSVCCLATIRTATDGKEYQSVYSYEFLPSWSHTYLVEGRSAKNIDRFISKIQDGEYGCKDYYELTPMKEYDPQNNVVNTTNSAVIRPQMPVDNKVLSSDPVDDLPF
jgi:hypothetical protein